MSMGLFDRHSDKIPEATFNVEKSNMSTIFTEFGYAWHTFKPYVLLLLGCAFAFYVMRKYKNQYADD
ncbi:MULTISPECIES: hypothetical protein [Bacillus cereus group]|jgi:hypothetical protein|uniref:Uncharacterized protein n=2 Tax=Bacillus cereus group TaxID=86661 RepID=A0AAW6YXK5_9BACI|nr:MULTISPECIES: hypothetical protein [Bacillus cereus group]EJP95775.1 hypothetical protein IC5_05606 [Bacillus cereus AND1407]MDG0913269.1 hypothetical protein [Bacillus paranthracis]MDK7389770.1 hypothetical protein [Bacillus pacificus]MDK7395141.1 hypothetical protein [Bacillus pacificus]MDK7400493.1 hypothetical protein [Bacillus pacificus]